MVDDTAENGRSQAVRDINAELDERRIARVLAFGLPAVTYVGAVAVGMILGPPQAILVLAAGALLGVIALFWASLRMLSGDAALSPELEALDAKGHAVDALSSRKTMLVRALKDLDNERALGKLEREDYEQLSHTYRNELKDVLRRVDASLAPHRRKAEEAVHSYLLESGLADQDRLGAASRPAPAASPDASDDTTDAGPTSTRTGDVRADEARAGAAPTSRRVACATCKTSNEVDARFCKTCGSTLASPAADTAVVATSASSDKASSDEDRGSTDEA